MVETKLAEMAKRKKTHIYVHEQNFEEFKRVAEEMGVNATDLLNQYMAVVVGKREAGAALGPLADFLKSKKPGE